MINNIFRQNSTNKYNILIFGDYMKVKIFDENHEKDLEKAINEFLEDDIELIDIKYQVSIGVFGEEQVYCFSAMIIYK